MSSAGRPHHAYKRSSRSSGLHACAQQHHVALCALVCAVYLPRHKSGRNKGFGFTTFETEEELNLALQVLHASCVQPWVTCMHERHAMPGVQQVGGRRIAQAWTRMVALSPSRHSLHRRTLVPECSLHAKPC